MITEIETTGEEVEVEVGTGMNAADIVEGTEIIGTGAGVPVLVQIITGAREKAAIMMNGVVEAEAEAAVGVDLWIGKQL